MLPRRVFAAGMVLALGGATIASAGTPTPGTLDGSFGPGGGLGGGGTLFTDFGQGSFSDDRSHDITTLASGKLVAVGEAKQSGQDIDFALAGYEPSSGAADESGFSGDGLVETDFSGGDDVALGVAPAPNNRVVVVGTSETSATSDRFRFAIARYKANGNLDKSFSGDGMLRTRMRAGSVEDVADDVVVRGGKITAAGYSAHPSGRRFALARYTEGGALDDSFGGDGRVLTSFPNDEQTATGRAIAAAGNGKVVVAGWAFQPSPSLDDDFALARYRSDGRRDPGFDGDGRVTTDLLDASIPNRAHDVVVRGNGNVIAAGLGADATDDFALAYYEPNGDDLDHISDGFGSDEEVVNALALQRGNGKLLAAGESNNRFAVLRLDVTPTELNGDTSWSPDDPASIVYTDFFGDDEAVEGLTLANPPNSGTAKQAGGGPTVNPGDPIVAGYHDGTNLGYNFALARYRGN